MESAVAPVDDALLLPVVTFWKSFDLDDKRLKLDAHGSAMQASKSNATERRKSLAEATKQFRKAADDKKQSMMLPLIKSYQEEIDLLSKRAKSSESAFFGLYKELHEAPDPVPALESLWKNRNTSSSSHQPAVARLEEELRQYEAEFKGLKNQEITIRELREELSSYEQNLDSMVQDQVTTQVQAALTQCSEKEELARQAQLDAERKLEEVKAQCSNSQTAFDSLQSELFELRQKRDTEAFQLQSESEMVHQESRRMEILEMENAELRRKVAEYSQKSLTESRTKSEPQLHNDTSAELQKSEALLAKLQKELAITRSNFATDQSACEEKISTYKFKTAALENDLRNLQQELYHRPTVAQYENIKKKLRALQRLEYRANSPTKSDSVAASKNTFAADDEEDTEALLISRVRKAETELAAKTLVIEGLEQQVGELKTDFDKLNGTLARQSSLLSKAEEDLDRYNRDSSVSKEKNSSMLLNVLSTAENNTTSGVSDKSSDINDPSMMSIVRNQRDRFKERINELEERLGTEKSYIRKLKAAVKKLEKDNIQLYERIRYLESYSVSTGGNIEEGRSGAATVTEKRYKTIYDEKMNPFTEFNKAESQQRYGKLNVLDKLLLSTAQMILSHPMTRTIAALYGVGLHFLVFSTLYMFMQFCGVSNE